MTTTLWSGLIALLALYLIPAVDAFRQQRFGWVLAVLLLPLFGGIAWWTVKIAGGLRPRQPA